MKRITQTLIILFLLLIAFSFSAPAAHAAVGSPAPVYQETTPDIFAILSWLQGLAKTGAALTGIALLGAALQNAGKRYLPEYFPNNSAPKWTLGIQTFTLLLLVGLQVSGRFELLPLIDQHAGLIANVINAVLALGYQVYAARKVHQEVLAGLPVVGHSYSGRLAGQKDGSSLEVFYEDQSPVDEKEIVSTLRKLGRD